jgi:hypothetical protein
MIDAHQDVFARSICGEGMPEFYAKIFTLNHTCPSTTIPEAEILFGKCKSLMDYNLTFDSMGRPLIEDCTKHPFPNYYNSPEA